jgi:hypothetical protein
MAKGKPKLRVVGGTEARAVVTTRPRREKPLPLSKTAAPAVQKQRPQEPEEPIEERDEEPIERKTELPWFLIYTAIAVAIAGALYIMFVRRR